MNSQKQAVIFLHYRNSKSLNLDLPYLTTSEKYQYYIFCSPEMKSNMEANGENQYFQGVVSVNIKDEQADYDDLLRAVKDIQKDHISIKEIIGFAETTILDCGRLRVDAGLDTDNFDRFIKKNLMKDYIHAAKIPAPVYIELGHPKEFRNKSELRTKISRHIGFPCFIKPIDKFGAIGTYAIDDQQVLDNWLQREDLPDLNFHIEEYIEGTLYHCDAFVKEGNIQHIQVCEHIAPCYQVQFGSPQGSLTLPSERYQKLVEFTKDVHQAMNIKTSGVTHTEVFEKADGSLVFLEIANRPPGVSSQTLYWKRSGIKLKESHARLQFDDDFILSQNLNGYVAIVGFPLPEKPGKLIGLEEPEHLANQYLCIWNKKVGETVKSNDGLEEFFGDILIWGENFDSVRSDYYSLRDFSPYVIG